MAASKVIKVGVIFGGASGEHEVSVISAHQTMAALEVAGYSVLPIYINKEGSWFAGGPLNDLKAFREPTFDPAKISGVYRVSLSPDPTVRELLLHPQQRRPLLGSAPKLWADVFFPVMHGTFGEDGTLQGLLEIARVPYVGPGVLAAAVGMDKVRAKNLLKSASLSMLDWCSFDRKQWRENQSQQIAEAERLHAYPLIVKPVNLGSSIGVRRAANREQLISAIDAALVLDEQVMVEPALTNFIELNCAVFGPPAQASVCEQPCSNEEVLTFDEKYKRGGSKAGQKGGAKAAGSAGMASLQRLVPAPVSEELTQKVKSWAITAFNAVRAAGVARIDFLYDKNAEQLYFNEINTIPGSLSFYLWEPAGVSFDELVQKLVETALERAQIRKETMFSFEANLLSGR